MTSTMNQSCQEMCQEICNYHNPHYQNSQFANLNIDGVGIRCHCSSVLVMKDDFEPQPVKNLKATDEGEASKESQHASHPADLVSKRHSSIFCDLQQIFGLQRLIIVQISSTFVITKSTGS